MKNTTLGRAKANFSAADLRALRLTLDLTQAEMAKKLYMTREHYGLLERGDKDITLRTEALAKMITP